MRELIKSRPRLIGLGAVALALLVAWVARGWLLREILAPVLQAQLSAALQRAVEFKAVDTNVVSFFSVKGFRLAKGDSFEEGTTLAAKEVVIRYKLMRLIRRPRQWQTALRRVDLVEPYLEIEGKALKAAKPKDAVESREPEAKGPPPLPKTYLRVKGGRVVFLHGGNRALEIKNLGAYLDLRDLPRIEGSINFTVAPDTRIAANGACHLRLKDFKGALTIQDLDLGQASRLARTFGAASGLDADGFLNADIEVQGGFMTMKELLNQTRGDGRLTIRDGALKVDGKKLLSEMETSGQLSGRRIRLERFSAAILSGRLEAKGSLENLGFGQLLLEGRLSQAPVAVLQVLSPGLPEKFGGEFSFDFSATGTGRNPVFNGRLAASTLDIQGAKVEELVATAIYTLDEVYLTDLQARVWAGLLKGKGWIGGLRAGTPRLNLELDGEGMEVAASPLGGIYSGKANLTLNFRGPLTKPVGEADIRISGLSGREIPVGNLEAHAVFEEGKIAVSAKTDSGSVQAQGNILLDKPVRCQDCQVIFQERLAPVLALASLNLPKDLEGRASATVRLSGPFSDLLIEGGGVASGLRLGKTVFGDRLSAPEFAIKGGVLSVPESAPLEVFWDAEDTHLKAHGKMPFLLFARRGQEPIDCHFECVNGRFEVLKRLNILKSAEGRFSLEMDLGGTPSYPVLHNLRLNGNGRRIILHERIFADHIHRWSLSVEVKENEGRIRAVAAPGKKVRQELEGDFAMAGWDFGLDVTTKTVGQGGLPIEIEDIGSLHAYLTGRIVKNAGESEVTIAGDDVEIGAEVELANGVIRYEGQSSREGPGPIAQWAQRSLNFVGTITIGNNLYYRTKSLGRKALDAFWKAATQGEKIGNIAAGTDVRGLLMGVALGFDVRIKDGSSLKYIKQGETFRAFGKVALEPGGELSLLRRKFVIVDIPGKEQVLEFMGGDRIAPRVWAVGETVLYGVMLTTDTGESALVDELKVRLIVTPSGEHPKVAENGQAGESFMDYRLELAAEPEVVSGVVELAREEGADNQSASVKPVTVRPSQGALLAALTGIGSVRKGSQGDQLVTSAAGGIIGGALDMLVEPVRWMLERTGMVDVFRVRKASMARRRQSPAETAASGSSGGAQDAVASALENTEVTIGKNFRNVYVGYHGILLDASGMLGTGRRSVTAEQSPSPLGHELEVVYRKGSFKLKGKGRFYGLPDDVKLDQKPQEIFAGGEISRSFSGVGQAEAFEW